MATKKRKRGRPEHKPTSITRRKVSMAAAFGMTRQEIALAIGITDDTLRKHYARELAEGAAKKRMEILDAQFAAAKKGNVSAQKALLATAPRAGWPPPAEVQEQPKTAGDAGAPAPLEGAGGASPIGVIQPKGKKEQANETAKTAARGTVWETLLDPSKGPVQ